MNCEQAQIAMTESWMDGRQQAALDEHLAQCRECKAESDALQPVWARLAELPEGEPSRNMPANFHQMLEAYQLGVSSAAPKPSLEGGWNWIQTRWKRTPLLQFATFAVAIMAAAAAGHYYAASAHQRDQIARLSADNQQMRQLVALSLLRQQSATDRLQGVSVGANLQPAGDEVVSALLQALNHDANVNVRLAAADALRQFESRTGVRQGLRQALLSQDSPIVQISLIDWALEEKDRGSLNSLLELQKKPELHPAVRLRLASAIGGLQ